MLNRLLTPKEQWLLAGFGAAMLLGAAALWFNYHKAAQNGVLGILAPVEKPHGDREPRLDTGAPVELGQRLTLGEAAGPVTVAVMGAVRKAGLYRLPPEARVLDLIEVAGGAEDGAYLEAVNRAARLLDGTTLTVPWANYADTEGELEQYKRWSAGVYLNPPEYLHRPWADEARARYAGSPPPVNTGAVQVRTVSTGTAPTPGCINLNTAALGELETLPGIGPVIGQRILDYRAQHGFRHLADLMNVPGIAEKRFAAIEHLVCL